MWVSVTQCHRWPCLPCWSRIPSGHHSIRHPESLWYHPSQVFISWTRSTQYQRSYPCLVKMLPHSLNTESGGWLITISIEKVEPGVPQGTVLGPLLFLLYINDLPKSVTLQIHLFTNDWLLYHPVYSDQDHQILVRFGYLKIWQDKWLMSFNPKKCTVLRIVSSHCTHKTHRYYLCGQKQTTEESNQNHGVEQSHTLLQGMYIDKCIKKANSAIGLLKRNIHSARHDIKVTALKSIVRPLLE